MIGTTEICSLLVPPKRDLDLGGEYRIRYQKTDTHETHMKRFFKPDIVGSFQICYSFRSSHMIKK